MSRKRYKQMTKKEIEAIVEYDWIPVEVAGEALPYWMRGIPKERIATVYASGSFVNPQVVEIGGAVYSGTVAGYDVIRRDEKDIAKGFPYNKDHYIVFIDTTSDDMLLVHGPINKEDDHWLSELPKTKPDIEISEFRGTITNIDNKKLNRLVS